MKMRDIPVKIEFDLGCPRKRAHAGPQVVVYDMLTNMMYGICCQPICSIHRSVKFKLV